ncbi:MAG: hypothetical protein U9O94_10445 [Nanoarchaeota archaeon]|nr:hypothetical protein [Nanoarchaeota archaeon]
MFDKQKKDCLGKVDKSIKQSIDKDIRPLVDLINSTPDYYTTSSCSGRVLLVEKNSDCKKDCRFVVAEHKKAKFRAIKKSLSKLPKGDVGFKQESVIIHVCCRDLEKAKTLLKIVRDLGIKRAGIINIGKRIIIEIIGTEAMETIIARDGKILVEDSYLRVLIKDANKRLERNKKKIKELQKKLLFL